MQTTLPYSQEILLRVKQPAQYVGGETGKYSDPPAAGITPLRCVISYPDTYTIGMSSHALRVLYNCGQQVPGIIMERVFQPLPDFEAELLQQKIKLRTIESGTDLDQVDILGFTLSVETAAIGMLSILALGGIPQLASERDNSFPLIVAGGHVTCNPEPYADFVDIFLIGDGEESWPELLALVLKIKSEQGVGSRLELLQTIAQNISGCYIPALYKADTHSNGFIIPDLTDNSGQQLLPVRRRIVENFGQIPSPLQPLVPALETPHERVVIEIMRSCPNGCRFCQAGMITRPLRERSCAQVLTEAKQLIDNTGYDEIGLLSLSSSDHSQIIEMLSCLDKEFAPEHIGLSLPSLRVNETLAELPSQLKTVRKSGLTLAPEAATERLRAVINKDVTDQSLHNALTAAFNQGWRQIKLYFMIGLPTETQEDVLAISQLANSAARLRKGGKGQAITLSVSPFIPKPFTPFQWEGLDSIDSLHEKSELIWKNIDRRLVDYRSHDLDTVQVEALLSRGDRRLGKVILQAWQSGARLDGWREYFSWQRWQQALTDHDLSFADYTSARTPEHPLPWEGIDIGFSRQFLLRERQRALQDGVRTPRCSESYCAGCGQENCGFNKHAVTA